MDQARIAVGVVVEAQAEVVVAMLRKALLFFVLLSLLAAALSFIWHDRPDLHAYDSLLAPRWNGEAGVTAVFLGVSTVLISDGQTHLMTDGFFSRPPLVQVLAGEIGPDGARIADGLRRAGVERLDAVIAVHSHYDHAMDSPEVAKRVGAVLVGSKSTANIAKGWGLPLSQTVVADTGVPLIFGDFVVTLVKSRHLPHGFAEGVIEAPLVPPARALDYLQGESYVVHIEHPSGSLAIVGSAGFVEGALTPFRSDVVLLGVGGLSSMSDDYRRIYLEETVGRLQAKRVFPVHFDDFTRPLSEGLVCTPRVMDDFDATMEELGAAAQERGFSLAMLPFAEPVLLFPLR